MRATQVPLPFIDHLDHLFWQHDRMNLSQVVPQVLTRATQLRDSKMGNEANTKALLIDPVLRALGWDTEDLDVVQREVKVYEGTYLDYALLVPGGTKLYLEAKGLGEKLDDKKFIAQTVNYANNDGVVWCILTNGVQYRVFKTNEPVAMDRKLLLEVDLRDESQPMPDRLRQLRTVSREAVASGELDALGERVFSDSRVRDALSQLAGDPPPELLTMLATRLGHPSVPEEILRRSLVRILDGERTVTPTPSAGILPQTPTPRPVVGPARPPKRKEYELEHHLGGRSSLIRELFESVDDLAEPLGGDVSRRIRKLYIGYFRGKRSFFTVEVQRARLLLYLSLDPTDVPTWNDEVMRDATKIGHFGMGDLEYSLTDTGQLAEVRGLIEQAYQKVG